MKLTSRYQQQGAETLEFTVIAVFYFLLLFAVFEFSRALYTWNILTEATRRGAKMAAICPYQSPIPKNIAVFDNVAGSLSGNSPIISGLSSANVTVRYLDSAGASVNVGSGGSLTNISFVEVTLSYQHQMLFSGLFGLFIPGWTGSLTAPTFRTTIPAESLGADPTFNTPALPTNCNF